MSNTIYSGKRPKRSRHCIFSLCSNHSIVEFFFLNIGHLFCLHSVFCGCCIFPLLPAALSMFCFLFFFHFLLLQAVVSWPKPVSTFGTNCSATICLRWPTGDSKTVQVRIFDKSTNYTLTGWNAERVLQFSRGQFFGSSFAISQASFNFQGHFCPINFWSGST